MSAWLEKREWVGDDAGTALQAAWDSEAARWGIDPSGMENSVVTRSRLRRRGAELANLLNAIGRHASSEVLLRDDQLRLFGQLDVVVNDAGGAVFDLKTGNDGVSDDVRTQLLIYAHLYRERYGHLPGSLVVFSLRYGAHPVEFTQSDVEALLRRVDEARGSVPLIAVPSETGCKYCTRRLRCQPQWEAATTWDDADCVEGRIVKVENSRAGLTAVKVNTISGEQWVTGLSAAVDVALTVGQHLRATEVKGRDDGKGREWRATRFTRLLVAPESLSSTD